MTVAPSAAVQGGRGGQSEPGQPLGGPVLADDQRGVRGVGGDVLLDEEATRGGGDPPAPVQQSQGDGFAGQRGSRVIVAAQQSGQRGRPRCRALHVFQRRSPAGRPGRKWRWTGWCLLCPLRSGFATEPVPRAHAVSRSPSGAGDGALAAGPRHVSGARGTARPADDGCHRPVIPDIRTATAPTRPVTAYRPAPWLCRAVPPATTPSGGTAQRPLDSVRPPSARAPHGWRRPPRGRRARMAPPGADRFRPGGCRSPLTDFSDPGYRALVPAMACKNAHY